MVGGKKSVLSADTTHWPENLRQKYRKLAIPAVVAAVTADKPRAKAETRERREPKAKARR
jgi:hypothetical protein